MRTPRNLRKLSLIGATAVALTAAAGLAWAGNHCGSHSSSHSNQHDARAQSPDLVETAVQAGSFQTLAAALEAAGLVETLQGDGPFTVFAPTDEAFAKLPEGTVETLLKPENKGQLVDILTLHVVGGEVSAVNAVKAEQAEAVNGDTLAFTIEDGRLQVNGVDIVGTDIGTSNGVIHVIDEVLLPPADHGGMTATPASPRSLIDRAINRGAPLYNHGQPAACAAVYEVTLAALANDARLGERAQLFAADALTRGQNLRDADDRAWAYRRALDKLRSDASASTDSAMASRAE